MMAASKTAQPDKLYTYSNYALYALLIITPLIFLKFIDNSFELAKRTSLMVFGGLFIILSVIYLLKYIYSDKENVTYLFTDKKFDPVMLLLITAVFLSMIFSLRPYISYNGQYIRQIGLVSYVYFFAVYFLSSQLLKQDHGKFSAADSLLKVMEYTAAAIAAYVILQYLRLDPFDAPLVGGIRPVSTMGHSTFTGGILVMVLPFTMLRIYKDVKPFAGISLSMLLIGGITVTQSRAAYAGLISVIVLALILFPFLYRKSNPVKFKQLLRISCMILGLIFLAGVILLIVSPQNPFAAKLLKISELPVSARWILWGDLFEAYKLHPIFGSGVGTFGTVFETFASYELKALEPKNIFDHAHNVFLNTMVTMGAFGAAAYILLFAQGFICSLKGFFSSLIDEKGRLLFLAIFCSLAGYTVYSMAAFENTAILLYLFVIFSVLKVLYSNYSQSSEISTVKIKNGFVYSRTVLAVFLILYCIYNFYPAYNNLIADVHYRQGKELYAQGDFKSAVSELNKAVTENYECADYKFTLAYYVQEYCMKTPQLNNETKTGLLLQAEQELERAYPNFFLYLRYKSLQAVIKLQQGDTAAFNSLRNDVYKHDTLVISFRNDLARYYFMNGNIQEMMNNINAVMSVDPFNSTAVITLASYYASVGDKIKGIEVCDKYLQKYSEDPYVLSVKTRIRGLPDK